MDLLSGSTSPTNLIASATSADGTANYSYDPAGQLTGATYSNPQSLIPNPSESYSYDANGNRTNTGYVTGPDNELLSDGTYNYSYDADGNRTERTNIATGAVTDYVWDNRDRLVEVIDRASAGGAITQDVPYTYDAENRWIGESVSIPGQAVRDTSYAYCGNQIVLQFDGTFSTTPLTVANLSHRYLWGPAVDQILAGEQVTDPSTPGNVLLPLTNFVGTVCDLAQYNPGTGTTTVVNHRVYDSFGNLVSQTNAAVDFVFGFAGLPFDKASGTYRTPTRPYEPVPGRWLSQDPSGFIGNDTNLYRYCGNNPVILVDPSGLTVVESDNPFPGAIGCNGKYLRYIDDGQTGTVQLKRITWANLFREEKRLMGRLKDFESRDGKRSWFIEETFDSVYFAGVGAQHQYYLVGNQNEIYADNEINYIGIGLAEAWVGHSLTAARTIVDIWKRWNYGDTPSAGTMYWLEVGYNAYDPVLYPQLSSPAKPYPPRR
jgi:RHS repeat-associated protein